jgi:hypothetical protein
MDKTKNMVDFWRWHYAEMLHEAGWFDEVAKLRSGSTGRLDLDETKLAELALDSSRRFRAMFPGVDQEQAFRAMEVARAMLKNDADEPERLFNAFLATLKKG